MKAAKTLEELKQNASEFAQKLEELFREFKSNNSISENYSLLLMSDEEMTKNYIDKNVAIYSEQGEIYVLLVNNNGSVEDLSE